MKTVKKKIKKILQVEEIEIENNNNNTKITFSYKRWPMWLLLKNRVKF